MKPGRTNELLRKSGLRPTRQRIALHTLIFSQGRRHVTVDQLFDEAVAAGIPVSLATVYNTINQFADAGLLRILVVEGARTYFDTDVSDHHHFFVEGSNQVLDIPGKPLNIRQLPMPPEGFEITHIDVVIRVRSIGP